VYPVLEVNARFNMSTYQGGVSERFRRSGELVLARHYPLVPTRPVSFAEVEAALGPVLAGGPAGRAVVTCFATVNAAGRLYTMLFAPDADRADRLDTAIRTALHTLQEKS